MHRIAEHFLVDAADGTTGNLTMGARSTATILFQGANNCYISVCKSKYSNKIIILSALDNLIKGGAGQAVQNLNIFYNFNIKQGLV